MDKLREPAEGEQEGGALPVEARYVARGEEEKEPVLVLGERPVDEDAEDDDRPDIQLVVMRRSGLGARARAWPRKSDAQLPPRVIRSNSATSLGARQAPSPEIGHFSGSAPPRHEGRPSTAEAEPGDAVSTGSSPSAGRMSSIGSEKCLPWRLNDEAAQLTPSSMRTRKPTLRRAHELEGARRGGLAHEERVGRDLENGVDVQLGHERLRELDEGEPLLLDPRGGAGEDDLAHRYSHRRRSGWKRKPS